MNRGSTHFAALFCVGALFGLGMGACNAISGVDDYKFEEGSGGAGSTSSSSGVGASGSTSSSTGATGSGGSMMCTVFEKSCNGTCASFEDPAYGCSDLFCKPCGGGAAATCCVGECSDSAIDPNNCGQCGNSCDPGEYCQGGSCVCRAGLTLVGGKCVDLQSDPNNCGAVGSVCPVQAPVCNGGTCVVFCTSGRTNCNDHCVDLDTDLKYCGDCFDSECDADEVCVAGSCETWIPASNVGCSSCPCQDCPFSYECTTYPGTSMPICVDT